MPRPTTVVLGWVAATAAAIAVAYAGVSTVAGGVVEPLPATVGQPGPTAAPMSPTPTGGMTETPSPRGVATPTDDPSTSAPGPLTGAPTTPPPSVVTPQPTAAPSSPAPQPAPEVRSYSLVGGSATLRFEPGRVTVVSAEPAQGFTYDVEGNGTAEVRVEFESDDHRSRLKGSWEGGPRARIDEDDDRDDDDLEDDD